MSSSVHSLPPSLSTTTVPNIVTIPTKSSPKVKEQAPANVPNANSGLPCQAGTDSPPPKLAEKLNKNRFTSGRNQGIPSVTEAKNPVPIEAWYYNPNSIEDPEEKDPTLPHHFNPDQQVSQMHLETLGVLVWTALSTRNYKENQLFQKVKVERGYNYEEVVTVAPDRLENYEQKKREFFKEHLHEHEEIRLILEGSGYEDIRDFNGHWIRIHITEGVLIVLPKGMYHRFTLDETNYLKAVLLYQETPSRIQFDRSHAGTDIMEVREHYVRNVLSRGSSLQANSSDVSRMLDELDDELEKLKSRQGIVESTLDESNLYADAVKAAQAASLPGAEDDEVGTRLALVEQTLQAGMPPSTAGVAAEAGSNMGSEVLCQGPACGQ